MPRLMSFAMTTEQYKNRSKTVTRRWGWLHAKVGMEFSGVEKAMGLKKGEKIKHIGPGRIKNVRREPLDAMIKDIEYGREEMKKEGYPFGMTCPKEFVEKLAKSAGKKTSDLITRIEFEHINE